MVCQRCIVKTQCHDVIEARFLEFLQRCDITERVNFNIFRKFSKYEKTPRMKIQPLRTPGKNFSNSLSIAAFILDPENKQTNIFN